MGGKAASHPPPYIMPVLCGLVNLPVPSKEPARAGVWEPGTRSRCHCQQVGLVGTRRREAKTPTVTPIKHALEDVPVMIAMPSAVGAVTAQADVSLMASERNDVASTPEAMSNGSAGLHSRLDCAGKATRDWSVTSGVSHRSLGLCAEEGHQGARHLGRSGLPCRR